METGGEGPQRFCVFGVTAKFASELGLYQMPLPGDVTLSRVPVPGPKGALRCTFDLPGTQTPLAFHYVGYWHPLHSRPWWRYGGDTILDLEAWQGYDVYPDGHVGATGCFTHDWRHPAFLDAISLLLRWSRP